MAQAKAQQIRDAYLTLGIPTGSPIARVRQAWRALARRHHPDLVRNNGTQSTQRLAEINAAYDLLCAAEADGTLTHAATQTQSAPRNPKTKPRHTARPDNKAPQSAAPKPATKPLSPKARHAARAAQSGFSSARAACAAPRAKTSKHAYA